MSFVDELNLRFLNKMKLKVRNKKTGKIYPVKELRYWDDYTWEAIYKTEQEQIDEHVANGGHYCSSCGQIFYDEFLDQRNGELIIDKLIW